MLFEQVGYYVSNVKYIYSASVFLLMNKGKKCILSHYELLSTISCKIGLDGDEIYVLEGSISHSDSFIQWLHGQL